MEGQLILAATHLGNVEDIPRRSLIWIQEADQIVFEEDRPARQMLKAAGVHRDYIKWSEHREQEALEQVEETLRAGKSVLYLSDCGSPGVTDPGWELAELGFRLGAKVTAIPGPSVVAAVIAASPFPCESFFYQGLLPREKDERAQSLVGVMARQVPTVILDTPYRLDRTLEELAKLGSKRKALLGVDISLESEEFAYESLGALSKRKWGKRPFAVVIEA